MLDRDELKGREVGAFWEVLADEAVGVFVQAPLPGMIRLGEVDLGAELGCYLGVAANSLPLSYVMVSILWAMGRSEAAQAFWTEAALLSGRMASFAYFDARSTWVRIAPLRLRSMMVSPSQSPMRVFRRRWRAAR